MIILEMYDILSKQGACIPYFGTDNHFSACLAVCIFNHKDWAKDFEGFQTKLFLNVQLKTSPKPIDPEIDKHWYSLLHR